MATRKNGMTTSGTGWTREKEPGLFGRHPGGWPAAAPMDRYNLFVSFDHDALTQPGRFELDPDRAFRSILHAPPHRRLCASSAPHRAVYSASTARRRIRHRIVTEWPRAQ